MYCPLECGPNLCSIYSRGIYPWSQLLACVEGEAQNIFGDIQNLLTTHRSELTQFTQELREVSYNLCWFQTSLQICSILTLTSSYLEFASSVFVELPN